MSSTVSTAQFSLSSTKQPSPTHPSPSSIPPRHIQRQHPTMLARALARTVRAVTTASQRPISAATKSIHFRAPISHDVNQLHRAASARINALTIRSAILSRLHSSSSRPILSQTRPSHPLQLRPLTSDNHLHRSRRKHHTLSPAHPGPCAKRTYLTGRLSCPIDKRRSIRRRSFANSTDAPSKSDKPSNAVTWREALKSPRKAVIYSGQLRRSLWNWAKHMWAGVKLLAADVRVSSKILKKITHGKQISRRERTFMVQTGVDLARLVPFSLFLIIPLAEFALPFALRLFPNMLPSQFQDQMKKEEDLKRSLKGRLELAKYLSDVVEERAKTIKASDVNSELKKNAEDLTDFLAAIRSGNNVDGAEVSRFAKFFNDELTIDGAVRPQLVAMCKYMGLSPYGHDQFLRFKLRSRLNAIKKDDMEIMWEGGADSLTDEEIAKACRDRGIRVSGSNKRMRRQLNDWLDLSQKKEIPGSLLIMSRAFLYTGSDGLAETLGSLPDDVIMDVKQAADVGDSTNIERLEETLRQAKLIEIESDREARKEKEDEEKRKKKEAEEEEKLEAEKTAQGEPAFVPDQVISDKEAMAAADRAEKDMSEALSKHPAVATEAVSAQPEQHVSSVIPEPEALDEEEVAKERDAIRNMLLSLGELSSDSSVEKEREELRNLKLELGEAEAFVKDTGGEDSSDIRRFKKLVSRLEKEIERVDAKVGLRMKLLDQDNDGLMSLEECQNVMKLIASDTDEEVVATTLKRLDADADGNISKADLARLLHEMQFEYGMTEDSPAKSQPAKTVDSPSKKEKSSSQEVGTQM